MAKPSLKFTINLLSVAWGAVVAFLVWSVFSIEQSDLSISLSALAGAAGRQPWQYTGIFLLVAFCVWAIPTAVLWQLVREYRKAGILTGAAALAGIVFFVIVSLWWEPTQEPDPIMAKGTSERGGINSVAEEWHCKNDIEVSCLDGSCKVIDDDGFTPMSINVTGTGAVSVCAYSGCWEGAAERVPTDGYFIVVGHRLPFSTNPDPRMAQDIILAIDKTDNVGLLKVDTFAQPLICEKSTDSAAVNVGG